MSAPTGMFYALEPDGSVRWTFETDKPMLSSPSIGPDGTVYVGSHDHNLYAVGPDGSLAWAFETEGQVISSAAIGSDGTIHVGSLDGLLYALSPAGELSWSFETGGAVLSSPAIDSEGTVYAPASGSRGAPRCRPSARSPRASLRPPTCGRTWARTRERPRPCSPP